MGRTETVGLGGDLQAGWADFGHAISWQKHGLGSFRSWSMPLAVQWSVRDRHSGKAGDSLWGNIIDGNV
jgi:hypothetical protein